ncbi:ABC transporter ATP-binding protein, partial [Burkholderia multivorans]
PFEGGYAAYVLQRVERDRMAAAAESKRQNLMRKELAWLRRGAPARTSKPKFRIDAANELIADVPPVRNPIELQRVAVARLGKQVVDLENVSVS